MYPFNFYTRGILRDALDNAVTSAAGDAPAALEKAGTILPVETTEEVAPVEEVVEKKEPPTAEELDDLGLTKQQVSEARQLFAALRDPNKSATVVEFLATKAGFVKPPETKKEVTEQKKGIIEDLKEALGPELAYLADKMGPVLQKHLEDQIKESQTDVRQKLSDLETEKLVSIADKAQETIGKKYFADGKVPDNLAVEMSKIMERFNASPGQAMEDYMEEVLVVAARKTGTVLSVKDKQQKIEKNRNDAPSRLASDGNRPNPKEGERSVHPQKQMTLNDSISLALEQAKAALTNN